MEKEILITADVLNHFQKNGFVVVKNVLDETEISVYRNIYEDFLQNKIDASKYRSDLGGHLEGKPEAIKERITQIMVPGRLMPELMNMPLHQHTASIAKQLMGGDMVLDFDMLIDKAPFSNTPTPWHQDAAYWIHMPDKRAVSCWLALDHATINNGCMWYIPGSHTLPLRKHRPAGKGGGALECDADEKEGVFVELEPGSCVLHHGGTLHYSRGNSTSTRRRAFITNYRPEAMVKFEREQGYDHTGERKVRNDKTTDTTTA